MLTIDLTFPRPHPGQVAVKRDAKRFNVVAAGRRWGKNTLGEELATETALAKRPVGWFSPSYKILSDSWRHLRETLLPIIKEKSEQEHRLALITGGAIEMWTLEDPDASRGRRYQRIIIDEAASVKELEYSWQHVIRPTLTDYAGDAWFFSTPKGLNYFWQLYAHGQDDASPDWQAWQFPTAANPHIDPAEIEAARRDLPESVFRQEYLAEFVTFAGQFFPEWSEAVHVCAPFDPPKHWRRFGMLDYGYVAPFSYHQAAHSPDGQLFLYRELYKSGVLDSDQAKWIAEACRGDVPEYIVASPDLWHSSGKGPKGQSSAETYQETWRTMGFAAHLKPGDDARVLGWQRMREWLKAYPGPDGVPTAALQVVAGRCPNLVRTLPMLAHDPHQIEDMDDDGEDHAVEGLRYGMMSRPRPKPAPKFEASDFDAEKIIKQVMLRRQRAKYIGAELQR